MWKNVDTITGQHAIDFAAAVIDPICAISADKEAADIMYRHQLPEGSDKVAFTESMMRKCIPLLLKNHRDDLAAIFAANQDISVDDYNKETSLMGMAADLSGMLNDVGMRVFFEFAQPRLS